MNIIDELEWRGAINQQTDAEGLYKLVGKKSISLYCGIDPTGDSMHIGHLIPFMILKRFQLAGHHPVILIGGGTGAIGDPSGRTTERVLQTAEQVKHNADSLTEQMKKLFGEDGSFTMMNNYDWLSKISLLDFLRDYGKLFNINTMLAKDVVASRLETGISFTEFSYQILQSIDYKMLYEKYGVQLQIGGADQWGNITNGIELIRKTNEIHEAFGLTIPLMLKADGTKFGKTAGGAVWLDPNKTSPFDFYQYWRNVDDADVIKCMKLLTFLPLEEIQEMEKWEGSQLNKAKEILERHKEYKGKLLPFISEQKYNDAIKKIFKLAGVDRIVTILDPLTHNEVKRPIYEVASSHLARRTFIGNIYKKVKDPNLVSALSGHKEGSKAFRRYRDIDEEMKKDLVKLLD